MNSRRIYGYRCSWGSYVHLKDTGIILNNEMDDFSTPGKINEFGLPPSPANYIVPMSRPISSMCPTILVDANNNAVLISGSAGGTKITTSVAFVSIQSSPLPSSPSSATPCFPLKSLSFT